MAPLKKISLKSNKITQKGINKKMGMGKSEDFL